MLKYQRVAERMDVSESPDGHWFHWEAEGIYRRLGDVHQRGNYPLVICYIANWKITIFSGKIHYKW